MASEVVAAPSLVYRPVTLSDCLRLTDCKHASHCMIYSTPDSTGISYALIQLRFDGLIGFAGGEVDVDDVTIDEIIEATNRELEEEINYRYEKVNQNDWICSHRDNSSRYVQHFFAKQLTFSQILYLAKSHLKAQHFPSESLGVFLVPISGSDAKSAEISAKFMINFLRQKFAGNARQQMIETIESRDILTEQQFHRLHRNDSVEQNGDNNGIEVKAMLSSVLPVDYYGETVDVMYGLMVIRDNGLFDFVGTDFVDDRDNDLMIRTINDSLNRDLGSYSQPFVSETDPIELSFDNDLSHMFHIQLNNSQFTQIEDKFTETENFIQNTFGIFRIPFQFKGQTKEADNYVKRFFDGFLKQNFVNSSKNQLKEMFENFDEMFLD